MYQLTYGSIPFDLVPVDVRIAVDHWLPLANLQEILPASPFSNATSALLPNRMAEYRFLRTGEFFCPVGVSRWGVFHGITNQRSKDWMLGVRGPAPFVMQADPLSPEILLGKNHQVSDQLFMLPPRPIGQHDAGGMEGLWLVTLVDERYFFQFADAGSIEMRTQSTTIQGLDPSMWSGLLAILANALGIMLDVPQIQSAYLSPEPDSHFYSQNENPAVLLDSAAANVGLAVVRKSSGQYQLMSAQTCRDIIDRNRQPVVRAAGGPLAEGQAAGLVLPQTVEVSFPKYVNNYNYQYDDDADPPAPVHDNKFTQFSVPYFVDERYTTDRRSSVWTQDAFRKVYKKAVMLSDVGLNYSGQPGKKPIRTTAKAFYQHTADDVDEPMPVEPPLNQDDLDTLARQLARDFWGWQLAGQGLDEVYPATRYWEPEGLHDVIYTYRSDMACTRVMRRPWNQQWSDFQHCSGLTLGVGGRSLPLTVQETIDWTKLGGLPTTTLTEECAKDDTRIHILEDATHHFYGGHNGVLVDVGSDHYVEFKAKIDDEVVLVQAEILEGIYYTIWDQVTRGVDGTTPAEHADGSTATLVGPCIVYGCNSIVTNQLDIQVAPGSFLKGDTEVILRAANGLSFAGPQAVPGVIGHTITVPGDFPDGVDGGPFTSPFLGTVLSMVIGAIDKSVGVTGSYFAFRVLDSNNSATIVGETIIYAGGDPGYKDDAGAMPALMAGGPPLFLNGGAFMPFIYSIDYAHFPVKYDIQVKADGTAMSNAFVYSIGFGQIVMNSQQFT